MIEKIYAKQLIASGLGKEIRPPAKCMCCHDSGLVAESHDLSQFVEGKSEIRFICTRTECEAGEKYLAAFNMPDEERTRRERDSKGEFLGKFLTREQYQANFDDRLRMNWCDHLHKVALQEWRDSLSTIRKMDLQAIGGNW